MASTPDGGDKTGRRKRPGPPTLDLSATDVTPEQPSDDSTPEPPATDAPEPAASDPESRAPWVPISEPAAEVADSSVAPAAAEPAEAAAAAAEREAAHSEAGEPVAAEPPARRSAWPLWTAIAATLLLAGAALWLGVLHRDDAQRLTQLEARVAQRSEPARPSEPGVPAELAARLAAAEGATRRLGEMTARVDALEKAQASRPAESPDLQRLTARLDKLDQAPRPEPDPALAQRLAAAETLARSLGERVAAAESATKSLGERMAATGATENAATDRLGAIDNALRALNDRLSELGKRVDEAANAARAADRQIAAANEQAAKGRSENFAALRLALAAANLRDAVMRGQPFTAELDAAKPLVADKAALAALEPFAATGVPSAATLSREISSVAAIVGTRNQASPNASVMDRLQASAERLVRIRRVDEPPGDDVGAIVSRIEAAASRQEIDTALAALAKLPPDARAPAEAWIKKAQARRAALDAASQLARDATAALGRN